MKSKQNILVVASVGGHIMEAECALELVESDCSLACDQKNIQTDRYKRIYVAVGTKTNPFIHLYNVIYATYVFARERPTSVFSTGGPFCLPFALVAKITSTKFVYLDSLTRIEELSNSGKLIYKLGLYDTFLTQWQPLTLKYPNAQYYGTVFSLKDL